MTRWRVNAKAVVALTLGYADILATLDYFANDSLQKNTVQSEAKKLVIALSKLENSIMCVM